MLCTVIAPEPPVGATLQREKAGLVQARGPVALDQVPDSTRLPPLKLGEDVMVESVIAWLIVGAIAGWIAGKVVRGGGFGLLGNIVVGIIGAVIAGWLLPQLGIAIGVGIVRAIINAAIGAIIVLVIISLIRRV
jgi:uncharacterized membrane protein YeaQ/YmgE (transglycosylase-associated protein family)